VLIVERWLLGRLRRRIFASLADVDAALGELMAQLNDKQSLRRLYMSDTAKIFLMEGSESTQTHSYREFS